MSAVYFLYFKYFSEDGRREFGRIYNNNFHMISSIIFAAYNAEDYYSYGEHSDKPSLGKAYGNNAPNTEC